MNAKDIRTVWTRNHRYFNYGQQVCVTSEYDSLIPVRGRTKICIAYNLGDKKSNWDVINKEALYTAGDIRLSKGCSYEEAYPKMVPFGIRIKDT